MKKLIALFFLILSVCSYAQVYAPVAMSKDKFSVDFLELLRSAKNNFTGLRGDSFQVSFLSEPEYFMRSVLPGASAAIIRERFPGYMVSYTEFRGYKNEMSLHAGMKQLLNKITIALGPQLQTKDLQRRFDAYYKTGIDLNLKDSFGWFQSNIELLTGSGADSSYLYKSTKSILEEKENGGAAKKGEYFILLKISPGVPQYFYSIPQLKSDGDTAFQTQLRMLIDAAGEDFHHIFSKVEVKIKDSTRPKKTFTRGNLHCSLKGAHAFCELRYPVNRQRIAAMFDSLHNKIIRVLSVSYSYTSTYDSGTDFSRTYFVANSDGTKPTIFLKTVNTGNPGEVIITVQSPHSRPFKRSRSFDDDD